MSLPEYEKIFQDKVDQDIRIEPKDWMPDAYGRPWCARYHSHAHSEIVECYPRPTGSRGAFAERKATLIAKVQDEAGHGLYLYSAAETLGTSREEMLASCTTAKQNILPTSIIPR